MKKFLLGIGSFFFFLIILAACLPGPWAWNFGTILGHIAYAIVWPFIYIPQSPAVRLIQILLVWVLFFTIPVLIIKAVFHFKKKVKKTSAAQAEIEKELRKKYIVLNSYFDDVFPWFYKEAKKQTENIVTVALKKQVPQKAVLYAILFFQIDEQLKSGNMHIYRGILSMQGEQLYSLWTYLLDKLESYHYLPESDLADLRAEMAELIKENG